MWTAGLAASILVLGLPVQAAGTEYDCLIEPSQTVDLRSPVVGLIDQVHVQRGSVVKRGALLVSLNASVERAAVDLARYRSGLAGPIQSAESRLDHANKKLRRKADLATKNYTSAQERDEAEAEQRVAEAEALTARENKQLAQLEYQQASALLAQRQLRSPFDGVVVEQLMNPGELAEPGEGKPSVLKLAKIDPLRVKAILPVSLYPSMKVGRKAEVVPEKPFAGRLGTSVQVIDKVIDAASGTFQVRMEVPNPGNALPGGIKCKVGFL